jgi:Eukaryotic-type carbonic anhydrase
MQADLRGRANKLIVCSWVRIAATNNRAIIPPTHTTMTGSSPLRRTASSCLLLLISCLSLCLAQNVGTGTVDTAAGWDDNYRLEYTYDDLRTNGPSQWGSVSALSNSRGWGEWEVVRLASAQTNQDKQPLLVDWSSSRSQCGLEARPSPIELAPFAECTDTQEILTRKYDSAQDCRHPKEDTNRLGSAFATSTTATVTSDMSAWEITPFSLRFYFPRTDKDCRRPTIRLDNIFGNEQKNQEEHFVLLWLELHARSEHVLDGKRYDAELQMVHMATTRPNELAIVSILIEADSDKDHADFQSYLMDGWQSKYQQELATCASQRKLQRDRPHLRGDQRAMGGQWKAVQEYLQVYNITNYDAAADDDDRGTKKRKLQVGGNKCEPDKYGNGCQSMGMGPRLRMFPYNLWPSSWYFSYVGSLTSPPCMGQVHWRVMDTPL